MSWDWCDKCGKRTSSKALDTRMICGSSYDSPAEYESRCPRKGCAWPQGVDDAHERAAAKYDGETKDWR